MRTSLLLVLAVAAFAEAPLRKNPDVAGAIRVFEAWIDGQMAYRGLPGIAVGVVHGQDLVWSRGFGFEDAARTRPVTAKTKFRMASHTKVFTAMSVLQLRDAGKLRLDDPVSRHLPWFRVKPAGSGDPAISIEHLLTHSSGLPREAAAPYWVTFEFPSAMEIRRAVPGQQAAYAPEVRWKYSNLAFALLGQIVESASGEPYRDYVERHVLRPLGMNDSSVDAPAPGIATGFGRRMPDGSRKPMPFTDTKGLGPAAGLTSTVEDMARFVSLQFRDGKSGGSQILSGATLREMRRPRMLENDWSRGNGLGFAVWRDEDKVYFGHGGSLAGYKTQTTMQAGGRIGVVVLTNGDDSRPSQIAAKLMATVGEATAKAATPPAKAPLWDGSWRRFAGLYRSIWGDSEVVENGGMLVIVDPTGDAPEVTQKLIPAGGGEFRLEASTGGAAVGEPVRFVEKDGRVTAMTVGHVRMERVR